VTRTAHVPNTTLSPTEVVLALLRPLDVPAAERRIEATLGCRSVLFASARGALAAAIEVTCANGAVAVPAFTCAAVANAVLSAGKQPVYVDVDGCGLAPAGAWPRNALPIVQDTYGFSAPTPARPFVRDMAHRTFPLGLDGALVAVTSFEHSKSLSAGRGGLALTDDTTLAERLREIRDRNAPPTRRVRSVLVTLVTIAMGRLDYRGQHGAAELFRKVAWHMDANRLLGQSDRELAGHGVDAELRGRPDRSAARLVVSQLRDAATVAHHRRRIVSIYDGMAKLERDPLPLVRYPLVATSVTDFERALLRAGWDVRGRWFSAPLHPGRANQSALGYVAGSAPGAESLAASVVNLPTHPLVRDGDAESMIRAAIDAGARPLRVDDGH
jgi:dTDP-4-amino-4,6-dideoxygalactose transaminase